MRSKLFEQNKTGVKPNVKAEVKPDLKVNTGPKKPTAPEVMAIVDKEGKVANKMFG